MLRLRLEEEPEIFPIADDHHIIRFKSETEYGLARKGSPWFVAGQLLVVQPWEPDFVPSRRPVHKAVVWMRLLGLLMEFWVHSAIMVVTAEAGRPLDIDEFMDHLRKAGYARVRVEIDAAKPLTSGVLIQGKKAKFWQPFEFENLPAICYQCGRIGHVNEAC